ncbi:MAG: ferrochelatase, partial [Actinomycetia bacterium]|nr:ferrochelatase [Actinomycetes bacterium]
MGWGRAIEIDNKIDPAKPFAVLLLNLGGPDSIASIRPFLQNLFSDKSIIKLPLQPLTARLIARSRAKKVAARYLAIGGGSPILKLTREQAKGVEENLNKAGLKCRAYVGMSYWHPFIYEAIDQIVKDGYEQVVAVSLFPQYSAATSGACLMELQSVVKKKASHLKEAVIQSWHDDPGYLDALAASIKEGLEKTGDNPTILFSAHGLPEDFVARGDPYPQHLEETIKGV